MSPLRLPLALVSLIIASSARAQVCPLESGDTVQKIVACVPGVPIGECRILAQNVGCAVVRELPLINAIVITLPSFKASAAEATLKATFKVDLVETDTVVNWLKGTAYAAPIVAPFDLGDAARAILDRIKALKPAETADP
ncbi:MAG: hypothetical protein Q7J64_01780, partial [Elusimicrobiota bacterium]|nr:hypothetical protein [Elusimicrobiota bacterium]